MWPGRNGDEESRRKRALKWERGVVVVKPAGWWGVLEGMKALSLWVVTMVAVVALRAASLETLVCDVAGVEREALVAVPEKIPEGGAPLVFVFHGHGGTARGAAQSMPFHTLWPEAVVVYPQGLPTPGRLTDPEGKRNGWQGRVGDQGDRDLAFFDALLAELKRRHRIDEARIYSTGHSNGGGFTYLLAAERGAVFAAIAPSSAVQGRGVAKLRVLPVFHVASPQDELVKFEWQRRMLDFVLSRNGCPALKPEALGLTEYPSSRGADVSVFLHNGGHKYPTKEAPALIVKFFQAHPRS